MNAARAAAVPALAVLAALTGLAALAGCGIRESDVVEAGGAPTVAVRPAPESRMVLYFLGPDGRPMPVARDVDLHVAVPTSPPGRTRATDDPTVPYEGFGSGYEVSASSPYASGLAVAKVLGALLDGPGEAETAAGLTTALPRGRDVPHVTYEGAGGAPRDPRGPLRLRLPFPVGELTGPALDQLVCTTAYAVHPAGRNQVTVTGPDGSLPAASCPV